MPIYTYRCSNCGHEYDHNQGLKEPNPETCPTCGKAALQRVYKPIGLVFKGSGFYATDHKSPSGVANGSGSAADGKSESSSDSQSTESKKESKPESSKPETPTPSPSKDN